MTNRQAERETKAKAEVEKVNQMFRDHHNAWHELREADTANDYRKLEFEHAERWKLPYADECKKEYDTSAEKLRKASDNYYQLKRKCDKWDEDNYRKTISVLIK